MPSKPSSKFTLIVPDEDRGKRSFWRDKLRWLSRSTSRKSFQTPPKCQPGLDPEPLTSNLAAAVHNERVSTVTASTQPTPDKSQVKDNIQARNNAQANDNAAIVDVHADVAVPTDLWSAAYREAVLSFGEANAVFLMGESIKNLLMSLEETNEALAGDSLFRRGAQRLEGPLKFFKLALDISSPFTSIEPTVSTAAGVVSSVTAVAIAICGAEDSLNAQIVSMLEHIPIIDECDTLGQKLDAGKAIHKALVPVYIDLLKFYIAAMDILASKVFVFALVCNELRQRLPTIVSGFLEHAALLRSRIANATLELITDIKKMLQDNKIENLLGVNKDKQRSEFHCQIRGLRASDACKWIVMDSRFLNWYNAPTSEQLVIFGEMGCGKTVITAHVIDVLIHLNTHQLPRPLICYHYCKDDETGKVVYIYSSLILQLLDQQEGFKVDFVTWYDNTKKSERVDPAQSSVDLGNFFSTCVETLDRPLFVVIDGLDECDSESRDELVTLLNSLSKRMPRLKVFFSSRPREGIENLLHGANQIRWIPSRERDATIVEHTVKRCLRGLSPAIQSLVTERLSGLAQGSAIWVKLTIELIQKQGIQTIGSMKVFLAQTPSPAALSQLYAKLFAHVTGDDADNKQLATRALEILAVARRPLSILELGWAVALSNSCEETRTVDELKDSVDERRVLNLLEPFISLVDFQDAKKSQVRLVHQSLKELILRGAPSNWAQSQSTAEDRQPKLEAALLQVCVKYLLFDDFDQNDLFSKEQETAQTLEGLPGFGSFDDSDDDGQQVDSASSQGLGNKQETKNIYYDPSERGFGEFFIYASCFWVDHFKMTTPEPLPDTWNIVGLCSAKSKRLQNWVGQHCRPDCTIAPKFVYDSDFLDPLIITALYGPEIALEKLLQGHDVGSKDFLIDSVKQTIQQIIGYGDISRVCVLFRDPRVGPQVRTLEFFRDIMHKWSESDRDSKEWAGLFDLVFNVFDNLVREEWGNELLCVAASIGCLPIVERLFKEAACNPAMRNELLRDVKRDCRPPDYHQSIGEAVWWNHVEVLRYLLKQDGIEAHLRHRDSGGYNIFHKVSRCCNPEVATLLISHFKEGVDQPNNTGDTPLNQVVFQGKSMSGRIEAAKVLLTLGGADVRGGYTDEPSNFHEPLRIATRWGDAAMCRVLVEVGGADPRRALSVGDDGQPSLVDNVDCGDRVQSEKLASEVLKTLCSLAGIDP